MLESMLESPDRRSYCCPWRSHVVAYLHKGLLGSLRYRFCYRFVIVLVPGATRIFLKILP